VTSISMPQPRLWAVKDVMSALRVHRDRAYQVMHQAGAVKLGRCLRVRPEDIDALLSRMVKESRP
jgi:hypothetical protein